ncbi:hypothetical protein, conserved [Plasmodium gonderi]|uniref:RAP protein n=1 Tax=Plasmodium gonderi TaxID=77519 RepID=A0A1Y1JH50_PLAGO|nr:hypothetical protein, conserved [Plasmodium gonderi]GAW81859.1 hypothetical protein, conserved [Plasmodium gonderi]
MHFLLLYATFGIHKLVTSFALFLQHSYCHSPYDRSLFVRQHHHNCRTWSIKKKRHYDALKCQDKNLNKHKRSWPHIISSLESPIVGIPIGDKFNLDHKDDNKLGMSFFPSSVKDGNTFKLSKEIPPSHLNRARLNTLLCMEYLPDSSKAYLKIVLEKFKTSDLQIKENILFHYILKYLHGRNCNGEKISVEKETQLINHIENNTLKFISDHARILKKCVKRRKEVITQLRIMDSEEEKIQQQEEQQQKQQQQEQRQRHQSPPSENKIIDAYLKIKKKLNVILVSIKSERKTYKMYRKIKRNISFYDTLDRLIILNFFYRRAKHRFALLFFKKYIFKIGNKNNLFIINFINKLREKNVLSSYILNPNLAYHAIFHFPETFSKCKDKFKWIMLPINTCNYIENYIKENVFFGCTYPNGSKRNSGNGCQSDTNFLMYINMMNSFLEKRNYYFPELFLKQFCLYYSEKKNISYDHKWYYFLITLSFLMKIFYLKKRYHVRKWEEVLSKEQINHLLKNRVTIYDDDIFRDRKNYLITYAEKRLNSQVISYLLENMQSDEMNKQGGKEKSVTKAYSTLLLLQYLFLLNLNLINVNFVNRSSANHFENLEINNEEMANKMSRKEIMKHVQNDDSSEIIRMEKKKIPFLKNETVLPQQRKRTFLYIIRMYKSILSNDCDQTNDTILMYNNIFDELKLFVQNYMSDLMETSLHKEREIYHELMMSQKGMLLLCKINTCLFFMLLSTMDICNYKNIALSFLQENEKLLRNIQPQVLERIMRKFQNENNANKEMEKKSADFILDHVISAYDTIYKIYKEITSCYDKEHIKKLIKVLLNVYQAEEEKTTLNIFKRPILALNLKQIFFIFYVLNNFNLHYEITQLFRYLMKNRNFRGKFRKANLKKGENDIKCKDEEEYLLCRKILHIYCNSNLCINNSVHFPAAEKWMNKHMKYFFFYRDPLYIFNLLIKKYTRRKIHDKGSNICTINHYEATMKEILEKMEDKKIFHSKNRKKFIKSKIFKRFFKEHIYTRVSEKEYTLIFYGLMKYLYKNEELLFTPMNPDAYRTHGNNENVFPGKLLHNTEFMYLHFYLTWQGYLKVHKMSKINFLMFLKTSLLMNDMESFENVLLENQDRTSKYAIFINSLLNNHIQLYHFNIRMDMLSKDLVAPVDMYLVHKGQLTIFNLNYYQVVKRIHNFGKFSTQCKVMLFIDYRKWFTNLINLHYLFKLPFLHNENFLSFLKENQILLNEENFWKISDLVIFYGKCMNKRKKILEFFSEHRKCFHVHKNKLIKDAFVVSFKN